MTVYPNIGSPQANGGVVDYSGTDFAIGVLFFAYLMALPLTIFGTSKELTGRTVYHPRGPHGTPQPIRIVRWRGRHGRSGPIDSGGRFGGGRQGGSAYGRIGQNDGHIRGDRIYGEVGRSVQENEGNIPDLEEFEMSGVGVGKRG